MADADEFGTDRRRRVASRNSSRGANNAMGSQPGNDAKDTYNAKDAVMAAEVLEQLRKTKKKPGSADREGSRRASRRRPREDDSGSPAVKKRVSPTKDSAMRGIEATQGLEHDGNQSSGEESSYQDPFYGMIREVNQALEAFDEGLTLVTTRDAIWLEVWETERNVSQQTAERHGRTMVQDGVCQRVPG